MMTYRSELDTVLPSTNFNEIINIQAECFRILNTTNFTTEKLTK